ncbi:FtsX-like permease family protein [Streptomyces crystallinus]|uniref:ABC transporter permease n=1 Tax=Streptomyces crystallinus TaxID=68191 RepID=A0ABP3Q3V3_9ACTN
MTRRPRELALGAKFAVTGGREGWIRTLLTALGVGLGVALLFAAASIPHVNQASSARGDARVPAASGSKKAFERSDSSLLFDMVGTEYHGESIGGLLLRPEGAHPAVPPGLRAVPRPGEMAASPALRELLDSPKGELLRRRLPFKVTASIGDAGLLDPRELFFYAGSDRLSTATGATRTDAFGGEVVKLPLNPVLVALTVVSCVVLLMPVVIFIATAVRFGGERRDRRLAALRLVGADTAMTRWIAAGEALAGSALGLLLGAVFFLLGRELIGGVRFWSFAAFPADFTPDPLLAVLVLLAVPLAAVVVTLFTMRSVAVEPLGVVRAVKPRRRRLWWRLLLPAAGIGVLALSPRAGVDQGVTDPNLVALGAILTLTGLATLLPWLVEAAVARLRGGPVAWQLAVRRLQLSGGTAGRAVAGITVAVAGAISLQMMTTGIHADFVRTTEQDPSRAQIDVVANFPSGERAQRMIHDFRATKGVEAVIGTVETYATRPGHYPEGEIRPTTVLTVGDCATLSELARIPSCRDGDTFVVHPEGDKRLSGWVDRTARPGEAVNLDTTSDYDPSVKPYLWTLPKSARPAVSRPDPMGEHRHGIFATPGAVDVARLPSAETRAMVRVDREVPDAAEYVRNTAAAIDPAMTVRTIDNIDRDRQYASVQSGLRTGAIATMLLIALSLLVSQIEQLRERRRLLSVLVAFGTRRSSLALSVLWQTAVPVVLGVVLAVAGGTALGVALLDMVGKRVTDWWLFLPLAGTGTVAVLVVTLLSLPPLWRLMRPDGLRTE